LLALRGPLKAGDFRARPLAARLTNMLRRHGGLLFGFSTLSSRRWRPGA